MSDSGIRFIEPPVADERLVAIEISGHFTADDMRAFMDRFEAVTSKGRKVRLYQDMRGYDGFDLDALTEKLKNMGTLWSGLEKAALVGDKRWLEVYVGIVDHLTPQELRHFSPEEKDEAFRWLAE
jgi:hypothetical protein